MTERVIGLPGAVATIVGFVIGASIFVLPGTIAASAGPGVVLVYLIASLLGLFSCFVGAQIGAAYPQSGASVVAVTALLGPSWGFLLVWLLVGASAVGVSLLASGFAEYLSPWVPLSNTVLASIAIVIIGLLNLFGVRGSTWMQGVMVLAFLLALGAFVGFGLPACEPRLLTPFLPNGWWPVWLGVLPAYFSYAGFMVIIELAGEIKRPERTIPLALLLSFTVVVVCYSLVSLTLVGLVPWQSLAQDTAPISSAASLVFSKPLAMAIALTAIAAAASSINGVLLGYSRDVAALLQGFEFWRRLIGAESGRGEAAGVVIIAGVSLFGVLGGSSISSLAVQAVVGILLVQCLLAVSLLLLPRLDPARLQAAGFRLPSKMLPVAAWGMMGSSVVALGLLLATSPTQGLIALVYLVLGVTAYRMSR